MIKIHINLIQNINPEKRAHCSSGFPQTALWKYEFMQSNDYFCREPGYCVDLNDRSPLMLAQK
jgi:hypothetical protein